MSFSQETAAPGDTVTVTVSLTNYNSTFAASYPISALQIDVAVDTSLVTVSNVTTLETSGAFGGASAANYNASAEKVTYADIYMASGAYVALAAAADGVVEIMSFDVTVADTAEGEIPFDVVTVANDGTSDAYAANDGTVTLAIGSSTVEPDPEPVEYSISVGTVSNGTVTVDKATAEAGETVTVTATANSGYELSAILVDGVAISGNTFKVTGNHVVTATFKETVVETEEYTITVTYGGKGTGSVTIVTSAAAGATVDFTATPTLTSAGLACVCTLISSDDVTITTTTAATGAFTGGSFVMPESDVAITVNFQVLGDINLSGTITAADLAMLKRKVNGVLVLDGEKLITANVAGSSSTALNAGDVSVIKKYLGQVVSEFPNGTY